MAKIYGLFGAMTGKVADAVMLVRNGEQIVRKYQPIVSNPSTPSQVAQRAKLKLISQLSAVFGPYIAMRREGNVSARNMFTKVNYPAATYANNEADLSVLNVKLTKSVVNMIPITATKASGVVSAQLSTSTQAYDKVVYVFASKGENGELRVEASVIVNGTGTQSLYEASQRVGAATMAYVFAYGVRFNSETAKAKYGNLMVDATSVAQLVVNRIVNDSDVTFTETTATAAVENREPEDKEAKKK